MDIYAILTYEFINNFGGLHMKKKQKTTLLTLALIPAAIVSLPEAEVKAADAVNSKETISDSWINPYHLYDAKPQMQRIASVGSVAANEVSSYKAASVAELKEVIYENLRAYNTEFQITYTGDTSKLKEVWAKIFEDLQTDQAMVYEAGTLSRYGFSASMTSTEATIKATINYHTTAAQEQFVNSEVKRIASDIFTTTMSDFDKIKAVNDYIVLNTTYSTNTTASPHAAYAILKEGQGVCQAYALLAYRLLQEAKIEAYYVTGEVGVEGHAWNLVKLDNEWYHLDTTWNDPVFNASAGDMSDFLRYKYFLISDTTIKKDHKIDNKNYPVASSEKYVPLSSIENPVIVDSQWYFPNKNDDILLYTVDLNNLAAGITKVTDTRVKYLVHHDGWLYFSNYSNGGFLSKMKLDGSNLEVIEKLFIKSLKISNGNLVYTDSNNKDYIKPLIDSTIVNQQAATQVITSISTIDEQSVTYLEDVANARKAYDALTADQKALVTNLQALIDFESSIKATNEIIATVISAIASLDQYDENFAQQVQAAQAAFDALTKTQKEKVTNNAALVEAQNQVIENNKISTAFVNAINTIDVNDAAYYQQTIDARAQYDKLTLAQKILISQSDFDKLTNAETQKVADENAVFNINYSLALLNEKATEFKGVIAPLVVSYDALTAAQKTLVTNIALLETARKTHQSYIATATQFEADIAGLKEFSNDFALKVQDANTTFDKFNFAQQAYISENTKKILTDYVAQISTDLQLAENVITLINTLDVANTSYLTDVATVRTAYSNLAPAQQALVGNLNVLVQHEQRVTNIQAAISAIEAIPTTFTADFKSKFNTASAAYEALTDTEKNHVTNANKYIIVKSDLSAAEAVVQKITALSEPFDATAIMEARTAYNALSDLAKRFIPNYGILQNAEQAISSEQNTIIAQSVIEQIKALQTVTPSFVANYDAALAAYENLTPEQQAKVTNYTDLANLTTTVSAIKVAIEAISKLETTTYPTIEAFEVAVNDATMLFKVVQNLYKTAVTNQTSLPLATTTITNVKDLVASIVALTINSDTNDFAATKASYEALTEQQKAFVTNYAQIEAIENQIVVNKVDTLINALNEEAATFIADVAHAEAAYNKLNPAQQALVNENAKLVAAIERAAEIAISIEAAASVIKLIAAIDETAASFSTDLQTAKDALGTLGAEDQAYVTNANTLTEHENTLTIYQQEAAAFEAQIVALDSAQPTFTTDVEVANTKFNQLNAAQQSLVAESAIATLKQLVLDLQEIRTLDAQILALNSLKPTYHNDVAAAQELFDKLSTNYKAIISAEATEKLTVAQAIVTADKEAANDVVTKITSLTSSSDRSDVSAARAAFNALTANQKQLITNLQALVTLENAQSNTGGSGGASGSGGGSNSSGDSGGSGGSAGGGSSIPTNPSEESSTNDVKPTIPTAPSVMQEGNTLKVNVPIAEYEDSTDPIVITASENINISIPANAVPQGQDGATLALAIENNDGKIQIQATLNDVPATFATYIEVEINNLPENAVLLRIDENGNKVATPFIIKDGKYIIKTMTSGEFIVSTEEKTFTDVANDGHKDYIEALAKRHIVFGATEENFDPTAGISRAQFATMVARAMGLQPEGSTTFKDVEGKWYADSVQALFEAGIVNGKSESAFDPDQTLTRQQVTLMTVRLLQFSGVELPPADLSAIPFTDLDKIPVAYREAVAQVYALGIFSGKSDGSFDPSGELTRSQMAKVLYKTLELAKML